MRKPPPITEVPAPIVLVIAGEPIAQPRQDGRAVRNKHTGKTFVQMYTPAVKRKLPDGRMSRDLLAMWRDAIKLAALGAGAPGWEGPVVLSADFYFPRPEYMLEPGMPNRRIPFARRPDRDNLDKAVLDALKEANVFRDDGQVYGGAIWKWYVARGCVPGARIQITFQNLFDDGQQTLPLLSKQE